MEKATPPMTVALYGSFAYFFFFLIFIVEETEYLVVADYQPYFCRYHQQ